MKIALAIGAALLIANANATTHRSAKARAEFVKQNPCPATGARGRCLGYVVDHVTPLCAGGRDHHSNMQWQTVKDAKIKDRLEVARCRKSSR